ncbi:hypothetical protein [Rhodoglobus vestalii]|nr:hypothetical protein [Rhodoglobus vestalii]
MASSEVDDDGASKVVESDPLKAEVSPEKMESILQEFQKTGIVEGSGSPSEWKNFNEDAPPEVFELANALWKDYGNTRGYGPVEWVKETGEVLVWWHGSLPEKASRLLADTSRKDSLPVQVRPMVYSGMDLNAAAHEMAESLAKTWPEVTSVTALHDGTGIEVALANSNGEARKDAPRESTSDRLGASASFPVDFVSTGEVQTTDDRVSQVAPYASGGRIKRGGSGCTSGFSVQIGEPAPDIIKSQGMMFANHCGAYGPGTWTTVSNKFFGNKSSQYAAKYRDVALMVNDPVQSGVSDSLRFYYPQMFLGAYNSGTRWIVVDGQVPVIGGAWCFSGSYSGTFCYNTITDINVYVNYGGGAPSSVGPLVETVNSANLIPVGQGDSGGPAFNFQSPNTNGVYATGIISGIRTASTACSGLQYEGRMCSDTALISPIYPAMSAIDRGVRLMTITDY